MYLFEPCKHRIRSMETLKHWNIGRIPRRSSPLALNTSSSALLASSHSDALSVGQVTLFLLWVTAAILWLFRFVYGRQRVWQQAVDDNLDSVDYEASVQNSDTDRSDNSSSEPNDNRSIPQRKNAQQFPSHENSENCTTKVILQDNTEDSTDETKSSETDDEVNKANGNVGGLQNGSAKMDHLRKKRDQTQEDTKTKEAATFSKTKPPPTFDEFLKYCVIFGLIMMFFYLCDYKHEWRASPRVYSRDLFMFLILLLFAVAGGFTIQRTQDKIINRDQTEEWKGWMQVMFVWYHYYHAVETYNYIRIFIACYVWMTGFGNFSFFWVRKDFSPWRFLKMLFRLNFLVVITMLTTNNSYMLYYICAMHTYWFLSVYAFMGILPSWNQNRVKMAAKFICYFIINALVFDTPLRDVVFKPLWFVLSYEGSMHEWLFRAGLDHYAAFVGMLCAYNYPHYERFMNYLDQRHLNRRDYLNTVYIKLFLSGLLCATLAIWYDNLMWRDKFDYNKYHPYTSWIPILAYIIFRNMFPALRTRYLGLFAFLGKITLETYIGQLHIYMQSNAHELIVFIPNYPLMNFALATVIYLFISHRLFHLTMEFSAFILPKDTKKLVMNAVVGSVVIGLHLCCALLCREVGIM